MILMVWKSHPTIMLSWLIVALLATCVFSPAAYACSGKGVWASIEENIRTAYWYAALGLIFHMATIILYFLREKKGIFMVALSIIVLVTHPAWTISEVSADCGMWKASAAKYSTGLIVGVFLIQLALWVAPRLTRRRA